MADDSNHDEDGDNSSASSSSSSSLTTSTAATQQQKQTTGRLKRTLGNAQCSAASGSTKSPRIDDQDQPQQQEQKQRRVISGPSQQPPPPQASSPPPPSSSLMMGRSPMAPSSAVAPALQCILCRDMFREPYSLLCGHSFCYECVSAALTYAARCPTCEREVRNVDNELHPNFALASVVDRAAAASSRASTSLLHNVPEPASAAMGSLCDGGDQHLVEEGGNTSPGAVMIECSPVVRRHGQMAGSRLSASDIDREISRLRQLKAQIELQDEYLENVLVREFLGNVKASVEQQAARLDSKLNRLQNDLAAVEAATGSPSHWDATSLSPAARASVRAMAAHFSDLEELYDRTSTVTAPTSAQSGSGDGTTAAPALGDSRRLASFRRALVQGTRYSGLRALASIDFAMGTLQRTSCIVSSVAFNSRRDLFALAGVTKEIKVYDLASAVAAASQALVYPVTRMQNEKNKVSCVAWSPFHAQQLGSTDYDGYVVVWDAMRSCVATQWNEHDKRCWTIDFNKAEPDMLATGSDDFKVKIWKLNANHSVNQIEWARSNVCTVDFHPTSKYYLVFGASDHNLYYFDLRQVRQPVAVLRGHTKAVSYAKFVSSNEIVSASIDGTLRLWDVAGRTCVRSYSGHTNEMNFVGLDTHADYIVCGSETNEVFVYYKHLRRPLFTYKFPAADALPEPPNSFVSALAFNKSAPSGCLLAANSQGYAKLLEFETPACL